MKICILIEVFAGLLWISDGKTLYFPRLDGRIVGGEDAKIEDFPHQILLEYNGVHRCGGSIISKNLILTAAHCVNEVESEKLTIRAGSDEKGVGGVVVPVESFLIHEKYVGLDYDIAVLKLADNLNFTNKIQKIPLPKEQELLEANTKCTITGWGTLSQGGSTSTKLQKVSVPVIDQNSCKTAYGKQLTERMFCAGVKGVGGKDACQGDSGGPLVAKGKLHGIVSWGRGCALPGYPGVYTRVTAVRQWIRLNSGI